MNTALATDGRNLPWTGKNGRTTLIFGGAALLLIIVLAVAYSIYEHRTAEAQTAFGAAMQVYQTPVPHAGQQIPPGIKTFPDEKTRAVQANGLFTEVTNTYGMTEPGKLAAYFAGLTLADSGKVPQAEDALQKVSTSWNGDIAALAKDALAQLYIGSGRASDAVSLYQQLGKGHATSVPPALAQLQLADLYTAQGKPEQARELYAALKDHDKDAQGKPGVAAQVATQKLNPSAAPAGPQQ